MTRISTIIKSVIVLLVLMYGTWLVFKWTAMRVFVAPDEALVVINKFGKPLPADLVVAPAGSNDFKGVQEEVLGPGRYFLNPVEYDSKIVPLVQISAGAPQQWDWDDDGHLKNSETAPKIGVISAKQGKSPPPGTEAVDSGFKGIQNQVLTPGTYKINPYLYEVKIEPAVVIPPGSVGVVTRLVGNIGQVSSATLTQIRASTAGPATQPSDQAHDPAAPSRLVVGATQR